MTGAITALARAKVRARTEAQMDSTALIQRGTLGTLDPDTGTVSGLTNASTIYAGECRVHSVTGEGSISLKAGQIDQRQVVISIPIDATVPARDDVLTLSDCPSDASLVGPLFRVVEVSAGGAFGDARRLSCTSWAPSRYWGE